MHSHQGLVPLAAVLGLLLLAAFVMLWRSVRRMAEPVGEVLQAADRVAAGDGWIWGWRWAPARLTWSLAPHSPAEGFAAEEAA